MHLSIGGGGGASAPGFVKGALVFSITTMVLMTSMIAIFVPSQSAGWEYENEMNRLLEQYTDITGSTAMSEQIWALTGIYTPYGKSPDGTDSSAHLTTLDGWVSGGRVTSYTPSQLQSLDKGRESYTVNYDQSKGLYYYTSHGDNLLGVSDGTAENPSSGTLYTTVTMDRQQKSNQFFTVGTKQQMDNGTFYYDYTGYRYCFQALSDYYYDINTPVTKTNTSLSLIWYQYTTDSGISGQLVLSGSDSGVSYITAQQIVQSFNSTNSTSKFEMKFNGVTMNIYIHLNPYAISHGYTVEDCYNNGYWDVMVTSPMYNNGSGGAGNYNFDVGRILDIVVGLMTFNGENYGLEGISATVASTVFTVSLYTSLIAMCVISPVFLIVAGVTALITAIIAFVDSFQWDWPSLFPF